jgi:hypothetical protein
LASTSTTGSLSSTDWNVFNTKVSSVSAGTGIEIGGTSLNPSVFLSGQALSFHSVSGNGFVYRTSGIVGVRTLTAGTGISITNGDGISGNPVISMTGAGFVDLTTNQTIDGVKTFVQTIFGSKNITATQQLIGGATIHGNTSGTISVSWNNGNNQSFTLIGNTTISLFTSPGVSTTYHLVFTQDGTGGRTVTWPSGIKWASGTTPVISSSAGAITVVTLIYGMDGFNYLGYYHNGF